eukprot:CAMPEP_0180509632 /NCGR_PEP_ID=MMETSP1036_2-20121128/49834_1 /TAXON_ID=632150 /ORGANISM="Azadinium spinosum, Strain 3D9" /LENGTH=52 /DNA_ID=CAMNT_0022520069 /DNA_START=83 /DNA_END=237 /DNA_ORIENTATION=+
MSTHSVELMSERGTPRQKDEAWSSSWPGGDSLAPRQLRTHERRAISESMPAG